MTQPSTNIGLELPVDSLILTRGRDFRWSFQFAEDDGTPVNFPAGSLFFELTPASGVVRWEFDIVDAMASLKVESEDVDLIPAKTLWQLVWLPEGEAAGGDPKARGKVVVQL